MVLVTKGSASFVIFKEGGTYCAQNGKTGKINSGTDASTVIQSAINALSPSGGRIHIKSGKYVLTSPLTIESNSIHITGESKAGDIFFTNDAKYHGFSNKIATILIADKINGIEIGRTKLVFGTTIENMGISGIDLDAVMGDDIYSTGAGIRVYRAEVTRIENVQVQRKEYGIYFAPTPPWAYDRVIDVVMMDNVLLCFNLYGIYAEGWVTGVRVNTLFGYINQRGLIHASPQYDWIMRDVWSNADSWNSLNQRDAPIYIGTGRDVTLENVTIAGQKGPVLCPVPLLWLDCNKVGSHGAKIRINNITLLETQSDAVRVDGNGDYVFINGIYAGLHGFYGGNGTVKGSVIRYDASGVKICVNGGAVSCGAPKPDWFVNVDKVESVYGHTNASGGGENGASSTHGMPD
ncbi:MAG: hypothetical protein QFX35_07245 [Candidatus Verstraetearchaeota archaeon]|nr:hypothetical protein [Candidatus Verstraetearchaeota archaeon]